MKSYWINVKKRLPRYLNSLNQSDYVLCYSPAQSPFVAWYEHNEGGFIVAHSNATNELVTTVTHWMKLPATPKSK